MSTLYDTICNFLRIASPEHITTFLVVYQVMNEEAWIAKETLRQLLHQSISAVLPSYTPDSDKHRKLLGLPLKIIVEEPVKYMQASPPSLIKPICDEFVSNYDDGTMKIPPQKLSHVNWWERGEVLRNITVRILETL
ncbi:2985_t:CDS:2 [Ambispora gerdemannii]|uniref:2985_t:CDS:1 n=1 Tax=Ambispora gerdemannii TaxID=144530 RepID=A0A9N9DPW9_9GLOM|nr:2985_t:CDS:2 [Ambispora gerdemannii]